MRFSRWVLSLFASPLGLFVLAALDSTIFFSLPFGIDALVILMAAKMRGLWWTVPLLATTGAVAGAAVSYWMGMKIGEKGLDRYVTGPRLERIRKRIKDSGAIAIAILDLIPPPFPFTLFVLAAGALELQASTFFITLTLCRLLRFGVEAALALIYGRQIVGWLETDIFHDIVAVLIVLAMVLTTLSIIRVVRATRPSRRRRAAA